MKEYNYEYFLPYGLDELWNAMQSPEDLTITPGSDKATIEVTGEHAWKTTRVNSTTAETVVTDNSAVIDPENHRITATIFSHAKGKTDNCIITLYYVGENRTRMTITYQMRYKLFNYRHWMTRLSFAVTKGAMIQATANRVRDKIIERISEEA